MAVIGSRLYGLIDGVPTLAIYAAEWHNSTTDTPVHLLATPSDDVDRIRLLASSQVAGAAGQCGTVIIAVATIEGLRLLDGTCMNLAVPESVTPGYEKRVKNHGFAKANGGGFGDMLVRFDIQFPAPGKLSGGLNVEKRKELRKLLE